ncbi:MAG: TonB-dependent receptor [Lysobacteraceae bacterium]
MLAVALSMCFAGAALADTGGLRISITSSSGTPVAGATVKVSSPSSLVTRTGVTAEDGSVRLQGLDPATNYTVEVVASGYNDFSASNVAVVSGKNLSLGYVLGIESLDTVVVTGGSLAAVDTTSATVGTTLTLSMVESLPTGRSYQSYLQLVPGVKPSAGGNPSSKSGVNYADIGGAAGTSSDNIYVIDGVDVTDPDTGTFGANFNSEIIQEQQVITGGVPAEYAGGSGLISKVVTKSGGDEWHGSVNYYLQNDSLVSDDEHSTSGGFSTYDTAVTLGGPIIKEKLWFFASYQKKFREDDVLNASTGELLRTVETDQDLAFLKATWQLTDNDRLTATFFNDPYNRDGSTASTTLNNRDLARDQGGDNYKLEYSHNWDNLLLNAYAFRHEGEVSNIPAVTDVSLNNVAFRRPATIAERSQGGGGTMLTTERNRDEAGLSLEYFLDTSHGTHTIKAGFTYTENEYFEDSRITGDGARYSSIGLDNAGVSFAEFVGTGWSGTRSIVAADIPRILGATGGFGIANASAADQAYFMGLLDTDHDGTISNAEVNAYQFNSTAGNPTGQVNNYRITEVSAAPYTVQTKGKAIYLQDTWTLNQWTVNAGIRAEEWTHFDSRGDESAKFDWDLAPRLSVVYDLFGDGRSKVWAFAGRYYDPIRTNMADFAGNLTGPELHEQIFLGDRWLTFRSRGGPKTPDALFAPSTKTPYTDEFLVGYSTTFRDDISLSFTVTQRQTRDILEDYDLGLYSDPEVVAGDPDWFGYAGPGSLYYLPYSYFGYSEKPNSNYVIGTLAGGKRDYLGYEVTLQKFKTENWQGMLSYTYNSAKGNTNSDSNADFQGDWLALDPRAPNVYGPQAGNIKHQFKAFGSYEFDFGLELSGIFNWNSGMLYTTSQLISARYLPIMDHDGYEHGGVWDTWVLPNTVGANTGPSYYTFDMRAKYVWELPVGELEFFVDVFNILDKQKPITAMALEAGNGVYSFGEATSWVAPRRAYLGVRYSF